MRLVDHYYADEPVYRPPPTSNVFEQVLSSFILPVWTIPLLIKKVEPFRDFKEEKLDKKGKTLASLFRPPFEICFEDTYEKVWVFLYFLSSNNLIESGNGTWKQAP